MCMVESSSCIYVDNEVSGLSDVILTNTAFVRVTCSAAVAAAVAVATAAEVAAVVAAAVAEIVVVAAVGAVAAATDI